MKNKIKNLAKIIAISLEKYTLELKNFLSKEGYEIKEGISKDEMQLMLLTGLESSKKFRDNFAVWFDKISSKNYSNFTGDSFPTFSEGISYNPTSASTLFGGSSSSSFNLGLPTSSSTTKPPLATEGIASETKPKGFFGGFTLNTGLDFIKDTLNSMATIQQSKADQALLSSQINSERDFIDSETTTTKSNTTTYVVLGVVSLIVLIGGVYYYNKTKK